MLCLRIFFKIIVPLSTPAFGTAAIFSFYWTWEDFFGPLIYLNDIEKYTVPFALGLCQCRGPFVLWWIFWCPFCLWFQCLFSYNLSKIYYSRYRNERHQGLANGKILLKNVSKHFDSVRAIDQVNFEVKRATSCFSGTPGCVNQPYLPQLRAETILDRFTLMIRNRRLIFKRDLAMVFQSYALYPHMNVYKNLSFGLETMKIPKNVINERFRRPPRSSKLTNWLKRKPKQLRRQKQWQLVERLSGSQRHSFDEPFLIWTQIRVQMGWDCTFVWRWSNYNLRNPWSGRGHDNGWSNCCSQWWKRSRLESHWSYITSRIMSSLLLHWLT